MQNGKFNIPIEIFLPPDFPVAAPAPFVRPTAAMCLAPTHPFVDVSSGMVNTPAVVSWAFPGSKLAGVLAEMSTHFGEQSPVYARSVTDPASPATSSQHSTPVISPYGSHYRPPAPASPPGSNPYSTSNGSYFPNPLRNPAPSASRPAQPSTMYPTYPTPTVAGGAQYPGAVHNPYISAGHPAHSGPDAGLYSASRVQPVPPGYPIGAAAGYPSGPSHLQQPQPVPPPVKPGISAEAAKSRRSAAFRRTAVESLTKRLLASLQQSEPEIQNQTIEMLEQTAKIEANRKVGCRSIPLYPSWREWHASLSQSCTLTMVDPLPRTIRCGNGICTAASQWVPSSCTTSIVLHYVLPHTCTARYTAAITILFYPPHVIWDVCSP